MKVLRAVLVQLVPFVALPGASVSDDTLLNDWLQVFRKKRELAEKESRIMLQ